MITSIPGTTTTASASIEYVRVYLVITISTRINIVYKRVTNIAKDIRARDCRLNRFKDKLTFLRRGIIILIRNTRLPDIEYK